MVVPTYMLIGLVLGFVLHHWPGVLGAAVVLSSLGFGALLAASLDANAAAAAFVALPNHALGAVIGWLVRDALPARKAR